LGLLLKDEPSFLRVEKDDDDDTEEKGDPKGEGEGEAVAGEKKAGSST